MFFISYHLIISYVLKSPWLLYSTHSKWLPCLYLPQICGIGKGKFRPTSYNHCSFPSVFLPFSTAIQFHSLNFFLWLWESKVVSLRVGALLFKIFSFELGTTLRQKTSPEGDITKLDDAIFSCHLLESWMFHFHCKSQGNDGPPEFIVFPFWLSLHSLMLVWHQGSFMHRA